MTFKLLKVGTDTELFLRDKKTGLPVSVEGLLGGTKHRPREVLGGKGFAVQEDNVMAEFNVPPASNADEFSNNIGRMINYLKTEEFEPRGLDLLAAPSMEFSREQLNTRQAGMFGCEPDYCAWTLEENEVAHSPELECLRTCGGHLHVSFTVDGKNPALEDMLLMVKALDVFLGIPGIHLDPDTRRKSRYGKAGAFRVKRYGEFDGIEYRVLSNFWVKSEELRKWAFNSINRAIQLIAADREVTERRIVRRDIDIIHAINANDAIALPYFAENFPLLFPLENKEVIL